MKHFESINRGYNSVFQAGKLSIGVVVPIEHYAQSTVPTMAEHLQRVRLIEKLGFRALWLRDIPFHVPSFGDAGQTFDPFTYLGFLAGQTSEIALGISSIALPLHHPVRIAQSAATVDRLSGGRLIMGIASGDRFDDYPGMGIDYEARGERFREAFAYIRAAQESFPTLETAHFGTLRGHIDILPKPTGHKIPMLVTGYSRQSLEWNAENGDGWMNYPRNPHQQQATIVQWRELVAQAGTVQKPFLQPLYIDLQDRDDFKPQPIHLGMRLGIDYLLDYLHHLQDIGVNHLALNLRFNSNPIEHTLQSLAEKLLPHFHSPKDTPT